ncbi:MAG: hypothetical protein JNM10_02180 [Planctomycetia bacterium]|nr:hypothetical protein [Planctomycetia bacterium]
MNAADDRVPLVFEDTASARDVFLAWEKGRIVFNAALVLATLLGIALNDRASLVDAAFRRALLAGGIAMNVLYCAGPVAEGYLVLTGAERRNVRALVLALGCLAGAALALLGVLTWRVMDGID